MAAKNLSERIYLTGLILLYALIGTPGCTNGFEETKHPYYSNLHPLTKSVHLDYRDVHTLRLKRAANGDVSPGGADSPGVPATAENVTKQVTAPPPTVAATTQKKVMTPQTTAKSAGTTVGPTTKAPTTQVPTTMGVPGTTPNYTESHDTHQYYESYIISDHERAKKMWIDPYSMENEEKGHKVVQHSILSNSHRTAATVGISFKFLFYGHLVQKVTIATGGFLYMSSFLHQWLTATQYIAPLMANFDSTIGESSDIRYIDNGTMFLVQWQNIQLKDDEAGPFTFQAALRDDGVILFNYKQVPKAVQYLSKAEHPVKVGMADAYYIDTMIRSDLRRRTIYEYHRVEIDQKKIGNNTSVKIIPFLTCIQQTGCDSCFMPNITFTCRWCAKLKRCSDGMDRHRQAWLTKGCASAAVTNGTQCAKLPKHQQGRPTTSAKPPLGKKKCTKDNPSNCPDKAGNKGAGLTVGIIIAIFVVVLLVVGFVGWFWYAYKNPTSRSGMWLMEHRPSQLKMKMKFWKRGGEGGEKYQVSVENSGSESVA